MDDGKKEQIKREIVEYFKNDEEQVFQEDLLEFVPVRVDCTQKDVKEVLSEMKKSGKIYNVKGMTGFVGMHEYD